MQVKKQFKWFTIFEYEKEQDYLRDMHKAGWKFVRVSGFGTYHFEKCMPGDVVYQLDYNQEGLKNKEEYVKMFNDCGWEYLQDYAGYSYFRKPVSESGVEEEIFCDDESRIQMMERVKKGRLLPLLILFSTVLLPQFILQLFCFHNYVIATFYGGILAVYLFVFATFSIKFNQYKTNIEK